MFREFYKYPYNIPKEYGIIEEIVLRGRLYGHFCGYKIFMRDTDKMCYVDCQWQRRCKKALKKVPPDEITDLNIKIQYDGKNVRPKTFDIEYCINGRLVRVPTIYN